ncbi:MAG: phytanoyl-CoA dioxygenase family protein [Candidatus Sericytochromatia bacterium]
MKENLENLNFLVGLIKIASIDTNVIKEFETIKNYYQEIQKNNDTLNKFNSLFLKEFDFDNAKNFTDDKKDLFFNLSIMLSFLDEFSEKEEEFIKDYANKLNYSIEKVSKIINDLKFETSKNLDFDLLFWFRKVVNGYINYLKTGITTFETYYSFRHLYFLTNKRINYLMIFLAEIFNGDFQEKNIKILGNDIDEVVKSVKENGYFVFKERIDEEIIDKIQEIANNNRCYPIFSDRKFSDCFLDEGVIFNNSEYVSTRYEYSLKLLINTPEVFEIIQDNNFTALSQQFFNSKSLLTTLNLWWTTPIRDDMDRYTGQVFHIDIDRSQVLLILIYINDVDENNGPHIYVKNSHKNVPHHLLQDRRMKEDEMINEYSKENLIRITGKKGTVIVTDPIGFHRGEPLHSDNRLALKFEFSTDGFGEMLPKMVVENNETKEIINKLKSQYDYTFSKFE